MYQGLRGLTVCSESWVSSHQMRSGLKEARGQRELARVASHPVPKGSRGQTFVAALRLKNQTLGAAGCHGPLSAH